jgi:hypothetical protein
VARKECELISPRLPTRILYQRDPFVITSYLYTTDFGGRLTIQSLVRAYEIVIDLHALEDRGCLRL